MDKVLSTIYLKVKSETQTLTKSAIAQILVKIIYSSEKRMSLKDIIASYKAFTNRKCVDEQIITELIENLCKNSEIQISSKNEYYLSPSRRKQICKCCEDSANRTNAILARYFFEVHTEKEVIRQWFQDVTLHFFQFFSDEWISDLLKTKDAVIHSKDSIKDMVERRTRNIKGVDKKDYEILPKLFFKFLGSKDSDVTAYLWEYGTSAFSAKLISNTTGIDALTLDVFKGSKCLLDTNILMFIKLDASKFHNALISLENTFSTLRIKLGVLYITKQEFQHKIEHQRCLTLNNLEKFGLDLTSNANDDFTQSAIALHCRTSEDFVRYFDCLRELPEHLNETLKIAEIDDSKTLLEAIEKAQKSEHKIAELNNVYKSATGRDKRTSALTHDVGLIAGAEFLRNDDKWFILSEEISVNNYSKNKPTVSGLPLALRVETLINVLALNNGGDSFDADDYMPLFASRIQNGFQPLKDTFVQEDLYAIYEMNQQIALLPEEQKKVIVQEINSKRLKGESEDKLKVELERAITRGKLQVHDDLNEAKEQLSASKKETQRQKNRGDATYKVLRKTIETQVISKYRKRFWGRIALFIGGIISIGVMFFLIYSWIKNNFEDTNSQSIAFLISIVTSLAIELALGFFGFFNVKGIFKNKKKYIREQTEIELNKALENDELN